MSSIYFTDSHHNIFLTRRDAELSDSGNIQFVCGSTDFDSHRDVSMQEALDYRARELVDTYQYRQLFYSGGADSHTILKTFIKNNLPLNEIVISRWSTTGDFNEPQNHEINYIAIPLLKKYQNYISKFNVKITFCDFDLHKIQEYYSTKTLPVLHANGIYNPCTFNVINSSWKSLREHSKMCQIVGWEKPSVQYKNKKFYTCMFDKMLPFLTHEKDVFDIQENFYFGGDGLLTITQYRRIADILIKQNFKEDEILSNSNQYYFDLVNQHIRDSIECDTSNTICMGKAFGGKLPTKEYLFFSEIKKINKIWQQVTAHANSTDFLKINHCCSYTSSDGQPVILAKQKEIS